MRLVNAVRELRVERDEDIRTIALHTAAERTAMFVREADEAVLLDGTLPRPRRRWSGRSSRRGPTRRGSGGASSPSARSSPSCATASASRSSVRAPR